MADRFVVGDTVTLTNTFAVAGTNTDPSTVTLAVTDPTGTTTSYTYAGGTITKSATGVYTKNITASTAGIWSYKWTGTGSAADVASGQFEVHDVDPQATPAFALPADLDVYTGTTVTEARARLLLDLASGAIRGYTGQTISRVTNDTITLPGNFGSLQPVRRAQQDPARPVGRLPTPGGPAMTQIGADGLRYPTGEAPATFTPRTTGNRIAQSWETMDVTILWGIWAASPADTSFTLLGDFMEIGGPLANPAPLGSLTVPAEDITVGDLLAVPIATDIEVAGRMFSATYGRTVTLMGGSYDTELQDYADADAASYSAGQGGVFAIVFTPTNITGD